MKNYLNKILGFVKKLQQQDGANVSGVTELAGNAIEVVKWNRDIEKSAYELLNKYEESSLFLLANLGQYGPAMSDASSRQTHQNSILFNIVKGDLARAV